MNYLNLKTHFLNAGETLVRGLRFGNRSYRGCGGVLRHLKKPRRAVQAHSSTKLESTTWLKIQPVSAESVISPKTPRYDDVFEDTIRGFTRSEIYIICQRKMYRVIWALSYQARSDTVPDILTLWTDTSGNRSNYVTLHILPRLNTLQCPAGFNHEI